MLFMHDEKNGNVLTETSRLSRLDANVDDEY